jgi:hypothetical protein
MDALVRVSHQEELDGPYIPGPYTTVTDIPDQGIDLGPDERLVEIRDIDTDDPFLESASLVLISIVQRTVSIHPLLGKWTLSAEGEGNLLLGKGRWKLEIWTGAGIDGDKPARQADKRIAGPDAVLYFRGTSAPPIDGVDWDAFDVVVKTWRHASDEKDLAERALATAVRQELNKESTTVAALARRIGWSAEYTRLVGLGERLPPEIDPITDLDAEQLASVDFAAGPDRGSEPTPEQLIAQAMQLLAKARELMRSGD